jgi:hypothetical protein
LISEIVAMMAGRRSVERTVGDVVVFDFESDEIRLEVDAGNRMASVQGNCRHVDNAMDW